jgi:hypothetical protein
MAAVRHIRRTTTPTSLVAMVRRAAPWLPLALLLGLLAYGLGTGRGPTPEASGASVVTVTGSVAADVSIDATACAPASVAIGDIIPGTDPWKTAQDNGGGTCAITFGTTNVTQGVNLDVLEDPGAPASPTDAMKCTIGGCSGDALADYSGAEPASGTSAFGAQLLNAGGLASPIWSVADVNAIPDAGQTTCQTGAVGDGTCTFTFGATAAASDTPGSYEAQVRYVVLAR